MTECTRNIEIASPLYAILSYRSEHSDCKAQMNVFA